MEVILLEKQTGRLEEDWIISGYNPNNGIISVLVGNYGDNI